MNGFAGYGLSKVHGEPMLSHFFDAKDAKYARKIRNLRVLRGSFFDLGNVMVRWEHCLVIRGDR